MIKLLFAIILAEMALTMSLMFETPLRKLVVIAFDKAKQGRGPLVAKSVGGTMLVVFISTLYGIMDIQRRSVDAGVVNPTDQVLMATHILEASLLGFSLFLAIMMDRLHYYIRELHNLRKSMESKGGDVKGLEEEMLGLRAKVKQLESQLRSQSTKKINTNEG